MQDVFRENSKYFNRLADGRFTIYYEFVKVVHQENAYLQEVDL